ncbi:ABC transporter ATP-binding protein [Marinobacterium stanieri]|uniref:Iron complex transport system ATP-binding protein n=1 Tax=Marinobacterium stanieri TaxID=49186 RepID=A0A1N6RMJ7_9GAMM|nr:ABC transporter ATP-binding protein [Marinobacterium stanieri]SIQ30019.1 iron complex transport system ATP-binding protein [Marinobacterium stanieri]
MSLIAEQVCLGYDGRAIVEQLSVQICPHGITALIGPNGCGKSTLLKGLAGLLKPIDGRVSLRGESLHSWARNKLALEVAMLPQKPLAPEGVCVRELVEYGRFPYQGLLRGASAEDREVVAWAMEQTGVANLADKQVQALSGGQQQRVWIAMAIAQQSSILLLDEPTTFLDWGHQLEVLELLARLNKEQQLTVVMSLHDLNQAAQFADRILVMEKGQLVEHGSPAEVIDSQMLARVFSVNAQVSEQADGKPYSQALSSMKAIQRTGVE